MKLVVGTQLFAAKFTNRYSGAYLRACDNCLSCVRGECAEKRVLSVDMVYTDDGRTYCLYWVSPFKPQTARALVTKHRRK
jgi:CO dehydrogenase/acetyl-CoA synthase alpha subunit